MIKAILASVASRARDSHDIFRDQGAYMLSDIKSVASADAKFGILFLDRTRGLFVVIGSGTCLLNSCSG